ncbi:lecithin retinol acyltransferase family protein [Cupriavidus necator]|uniref:lecithin retinol acyltransferase family protein n=1 Tax=Cupriavidus necator TaxID=106590 RepID=UPI0009B846E1|nr:lecithin retinol acyltransferase family protein [Cupriavidus necator]
METLYIDWLTTSPELASTKRTIEAGAHLISERDGYTHHGIYVGDGQVIHYGGFDHSAKRRPVEYIALRAFAAGKDLRIQTEPDAVYAGIDVVERAKSRLGEDQYQFLTNNCEHFCTWCVLGVGRSEQVRQCLRNPWVGIKTLFALAKAKVHAFRDRARRVRPHRHGLPLLMAAYSSTPQRRRA